MTDKGNEGWKHSTAYLDQLAELATALHPTYEALVEEYRFFALIHHRHPFVSYRVLAELVRSGWVCSTTTTEGNNG